MFSERRSSGTNEETPTRPSMHPMTHHLKKYVTIEEGKIIFYLLYVLVSVVGTSMVIGDPLLFE